MMYECNVVKYVSDTSRRKARLIMYTVKTGPACGLATLQHRQYLCLIGCIYTIHWETRGKISMVVVENLWDKSPYSNISSFSESVHPQVPQKKKSP